MMSLKGGCKPPPAAANATRKEASALVIAASDKAGMEGIDRSRIDAIILRESGNSVYMQQQRKRDEKTNQRIEKMLAELKEKNKSGEGWKRVVERELEDEILGYVQSRPRRSTCVVVDMDMFYMAAELLTRPELHDKPCCVGGGLVTTSNYVARRYGVRSAMAGFIADKLVTELSGGKEKLVHIPSNFPLYREKSNQVRAVLSEYDPNMKAYSLDEVYLDIGPYVELKMKGFEHASIVSHLRETHNAKHSDENLDDDSTGIADSLVGFTPSVALRVASEVVKDMRRKVVLATGGLTCSAGLAPSFMLAKIASDRNKPNGQLCVGPSHEEVLEFLHPLPARKVGGIGRVTEKTLYALGISTVKELYDQRATVRFCFKPATAKFLLRASLGCSGHESGDGDDDDDIGRKGISVERTFTSGGPWSELNDRLEDIARKLSCQMQEKQLHAHTITLKVKLSTFDVISKARSLPRGVFTQDTQMLVKISRELLKEIREQIKGPTFSVRLLGIRCSNLQGEKERQDISQMKLKQYFDKETSTISSDVEHRETNTDPEQESATKSSALDDEYVTDSAKATKKAAPEVETDSIEEYVHCPVCQREFHLRDTALLNGHIDACLNGPTDFEHCEISTDPEQESGTNSSALDDGHESDSAKATEKANPEAETDHIEEYVHCPICQRKFHLRDNALLNGHIDSCLNGPAVVAAAKEETMWAQQPRKKQRLTDFFTGNLC